MHPIAILALSVVLSAVPIKAEEYRFQREEGGIGLMDVIVDSKGIGTSIQFDNDSDAKSMAVWGALIDAEINGTAAPCKYNGLFFDQPIIFTGEFTSEVLHTKAVQNGAPSEPYRIFKVKSLEIGFPFCRLKYRNPSRLAVQTMLETHFGFYSLFPKGIKLDGKKIDLSRFRKEPPDTLDNVPRFGPIGEQAGSDQPATKPADKPSVKDQPSTPTSKDAPR
ncbi:MAG: hypothetical protein WCK77_25160 [Verrucomicrobiota bacterium]